MLSKRQRKASGDVICSFSETTSPETFSLWLTTCIHLEKMLRERLKKYSLFKTGIMSRPVHTSLVLCPILRFRSGLKCLTNLAYKRQSSKVHRNCNVTVSLSKGTSLGKRASLRVGSSCLAKLYRTLVSNSICIVILMFIFFSSWFSPRRCSPLQSAQRMFARATLMSDDVHVCTVLSLLTSLLV